MGGKKQRNRAAERKPHFFKVLLGDFSERLKLPPNFLKHISNEASESATIQGPSGGSWHVELDESINGTFLSTGWSAFAKDHSLKEHEFLVFCHNGNMCFSVQVFDTSACEREDLFTIEPCRKKLKVCKRGNISSELEKPCFDAGVPPRYQECEKEPQVVKNDISGPSGMQDYSSNSNQGSCLTSSSPSGDARIKTEAQETPICIPDSKTAGSCLTSSSPSGNTEIKTEVQEIPICIPRPCLAGSNTKRQERCFAGRWPTVVTEEILRAWEAAKSFHSDFPYIIMCMSMTSIHRAMRFPNWFSRVHLPRKRRNIIIRDPNGVAWPVIYLPCQRDYLAGGWADLALGNNLVVGDFCAFELVRPNEIKVHIFRADKETGPKV